MMENKKQWVMSHRGKPPLSRILSNLLPLLEEALMNSSGKDGEWYITTLSVEQRDRLDDAT